jgi:hypothetical protein
MDWAVEHGVDAVVFHRYVPIRNSFEEAPEEDELTKSKEQLARWCSDNGNNIEVKLETEQLNSSPPANRRTAVADPAKSWALRECFAPNFPAEYDVGDPEYLCTAPVSSIDIGLEGQIAACCRSQDVPLGYATSVPSFAAAWFGKNYERVRSSLRRKPTCPLPIPNCETCIKFYAPTNSARYVALSYDDELSRGVGLSFSEIEIRVEGLQKEKGYCFVARIPPGVQRDGFLLYEDDRPLQGPTSLHDDIRQNGHGRYSSGGNGFFSQVRTAAIRARMAVFTVCESE